jgi:hypothetical protein
MRGIVVLVVGILVSASTAVWATNYGALAYDRPTGSWGASYDQPSQGAANERALRECGTYAAHCAVVVEFWNLCAAYATGADTLAGWGSGSTRAAAEQRALAACGRGGPCQVQVWACNSQPDSQSVQPWRRDPRTPAEQRCAYRGMKPDVTGNCK